MNWTNVTRSFYTTIPREDRKVGDVVYSVFRMDDRWQAFCLRVTKVNPYRYVVTKIEPTFITFETADEARQACEADAMIEAEDVKEDYIHETDGLSLVLVPDED